MGAVDMCDQLLKAYTSHRKSLAWFKKLGLHMVDRMLLNAFIVYKNTREHCNLRLLDFTKKVAEEILLE